jgi:HD-GYP domain-containing protein (c-di-GMP phosphodiesterase class II)
MTLEERLNVLSRINQAGAMINTILDLDDLLDEVINLIRNLFNLENCAILLRDKDSGVLYIRKAVGYPEEVVREFRAPLNRGVTGWVAATGIPEIIPDVKKDIRYIRGVSNGASEMAVPLKIRDEIIGVLDVESPNVSYFTQEHLEYLSIFATQVATAVNNARLHEEIVTKTGLLEKKVHNLESLATVSHALASILDLDILLNKILDQIMSVFGFTTCSILLMDEAEQVLYPAVSRGYSDTVLKQVRLRSGEGITGTVYKTGAATIVPSVKKDPRYVQGLPDGGSEICVPLQVRRKILGVIDAESPQENYFTQDDLKLLSIFASNAAVAINNARIHREVEEKNRQLNRNLDEKIRLNQELKLYSDRITDINKSLEKRVKELWTLHETSKAITSSLDLDDTLKSIVTLGQQIIKSSVSTIRLIDSESHEFKVQALFSHRDGSIPIPQGDYALELLTPMLKSTLDAPLEVAGQTIGVFELFSFDEQAFSESDRQMLKTLAAQAAIAIENARLFEKTQQTYYETIKSLAQALEARDEYTRGHSDRVTSLALSIARAMNLCEEESQLIEYAGLLHDIGKIGIPDRILKKPDALTEEERRDIRSHPAFGDSILSPIRFLQKAQATVLYHHERMDGSGYPEGLRGEDIPVTARIVAVADVYDAMTSDRPYRKALSDEDAVRELRDHAGTKYDAKVVEAFLGLLDQMREDSGSEDGDSPETESVSDMSGLDGEGSTYAQLNHRGE